MLERNLTQAPSWQNQQVPNSGHRTFLEQEQGLCVVALLDHVVPGGHDQRGQPGSHQARAGVVQRLEDVAAGAPLAQPLAPILLLSVSLLLQEGR